jgi:1,4-dihydroxy-2-naphthoyl-CoA hydrolase
MAAKPAKPFGRYPHDHSILCHSRLVHDIGDDGTVAGSMPVLADHLDAGGRMRLGALAPLADLLAGVLGARSAHPDWTATLDFTLHLAAPVSSGRVHGLARPLRVGKNTVLSENRLVDDSGAAVGLAHVTFSRFPRRDGSPAGPLPPPNRVEYTRETEEPRLAFDDYYGIRFDVDSPAFELDHHERIYNSFGSIQGGAMAALLERVAALAAERALGRPARTVDLHFSYLSPATTGPFRVVAGPVRVEAGSVLSTVELVDLGRDGRQCAVGTAAAVVID